MARLALSNAQDWRLADPQQDIRGWPIRARDDRELGTVADLIFDTVTNQVKEVVLDDGQKHPAQDIILDEGAAYLDEEPAPEPASTPPERSTTPKSYDDVEVRKADFKGVEAACRAHHVKHYEGEGVAYAAMAPAYRHGFEYGTHEDYRDRSFEDLQPQIRSAYEEKHDEGGFDTAHRAIRQGFDLAREQGTSHSFDVGRDRTMSDHANRRQINEKI